QGGIEIDFDAADQGLQTLNETDIDSLQALRMACNVPGQEAQELSEHRVIAFGGLGTGQHDLATGADGVVNLVALAEPKDTTHGFRHCGLVAVGQRGFDFEGGGHGSLQSKRGMPRMIMRLPCQVNASALPSSVARASGASEGDRLTVTTSNSERQAAHSFRKMSAQQLDQQNEQYAETYPCEVRKTEKLTLLTQNYLIQNRRNKNLIKCGFVIIIR